MPGQHRHIPNERQQKESPGHALLAFAYTEMNLLQICCRSLCVSIVAQTDEEDRRDDDCRNDAPLTYRMNPEKLEICQVEREEQSARRDQQQNE